MLAIMTGAFIVVPEVRTIWQIVCLEIRKKESLEKSLAFSIVCQIKKDTLYLFLEKKVPFVKKAIRALPSHSLPPHPGGGGGSSVC